MNKKQTSGPVKKSPKKWPSKMNLGGKSAAAPVPGPSQENIKNPKPGPKKRVIKIKTQTG